MATKEEKLKNPVYLPFDPFDQKQETPSDKDHTSERKKMLFDSIRKSLGLPEKK